MEFSILRGCKEGGGNAEYQNSWIFEHNSALNYSTVKKFHTRGLYLNAEKIGDFAIFEFNGKNR